MSLIDINKEDWEITPPSIRALVKSLLPHVKPRIPVLADTLVRVHEHMKGPRNPRQIVIVAPKNTPRPFKYGRALTRLGYEVIFIGREVLSVNPEGMFSKVIVCGTDEEV